MENLLTMVKNEASNYEKAQRIARNLEKKGFWINSATDALIELHFDGSYPSMVLETTPEKNGNESGVLSVEHHFDILQHFYGGKIYYQSNSGSTGAAVIRTQECETLVPVGGYRVDCGIENTEFKEFQHDGVLVAIFQPYAAHEFITEMPIAVRVRQEKNSEQTIVFVSQNNSEELIEVVNNASSFVGQGRKLFVDYVDYSDFESKKISYRVVNFRLGAKERINFSRFLDVRNVSLSYAYYQEVSEMHSALGINHIEKNGKNFFAILDRLALVKKAWFFDPLTEEKTLKDLLNENGFELLKDGTKKVAVKRNHKNVWGEKTKLFIGFAHNSAFKNPFGIQLEEEFLDYEYETSIEEIDEQVAVRQCLEGMRKKFLNSLRWQLENSNELWDELNPNEIITINDSLEAGNCEPGTLRFREENFPGKNEVTVAELKDFAEENPNVRRVLQFMVLKSKELI